MTTIKYFQAKFTDFDENFPGNSRCFKTDTVKKLDDDNFNRKVVKIFINQHFIAKSNPIWRVCK